jgi:hypothetical protein
MDWVFGLCVMGETSWVPWSELDDTDKNLVRRLLDWCPTCPEVWRDIVYAEA